MSPARSCEESTHALATTFEFVMITFSQCCQCVHGNKFGVDKAEYLYVMLQRRAVNGFKSIYWFLSPSVKKITYHEANK